MISELSLRAVSSAAGVAVLHFLWQGVVIGVLAAAALRACERSGAQVRYCVACAALGACALVFAATFVLQLSPALPAAAGQAPACAGAGSSGWGLLLHAETVSIIWCLGMSVPALRLCLQLAGVRRLGRAGAEVAAPPADWADAFEAIKSRLGVHKAVRLIRHAAIDTPMVAGWLAPVVLVPAAAFTSLTSDQLCAVLAHELAHIRRRDHLVNAIQAVLEVAFFFHPVVWWLSSRVRVERENCCDDVAVSAAASPLVFAEALAQLETLRLVFPQAAVAANGGSLMERIERVLKVDRSSSAKPLRWGSAAAIAGAAVVAVAALAQVSGQPAASPSPAPTPGSDVLVAKGELLLMVKPTVVMDAPDDEPAWSDEDEGLEDFPLEFQLTLTEDQHQEMVKKQGTVRFRVALDSVRLSPPSLDRARVVTLLRADESLPVEQLINVKQRLDDYHVMTDDEVQEVELQELDKVTGDINASVEAGKMSRAEADVMPDKLAKEAAERAAKAKHDEAERNRQLEEARRKTRK